jgi:hypothetical protein
MSNLGLTEPVEVSERNQPSPSPSTGLAPLRCASIASSCFSPCVYRRLIVRSSCLRNNWSKNESLAPRRYCSAAVCLRRCTRPGLFTPTHCFRRTNHELTPAKVNGLPSSVIHRASHLARFFSLTSKTRWPWLFSMKMGKYLFSSPCQPPGRFVVPNLYLKG